MENLSKNLTALQILESLKPAKEFSEIKIRMRKEKTVIIWYAKKRVMNVSGKTFSEAAEKLLLKIA